MFEEWFVYAPERSRDTLTLKKYGKNLNCEDKKQSVTPSTSNDDKPSKASRFNVSISILFFNSGLPLSPPLIFQIHPLPTRPFFLAQTIFSKTLCLLLVLIISSDPWGFSFGFEIFDSGICSVITFNLIKAQKFGMGFLGGWILV